MKWADGEREICIALETAVMLFIRAVRRPRFYFCLPDEESLDLAIIDCAPISSYDHPYKFL